MIIKDKQLDKKALDYQQDIILENIKAFVDHSFMDDCSIRLSEGQIAEIRQGHLNGKDLRVNGEKQLLLPGLIDLHSDALEKAIEPRPGTLFPLELSLQEFDKNLPAAGITSMFHCVAFSEEDKNDRSLRNNEAAKNIIHSINKLKPRLKSRPFIHLRFDLLNIDSVGLIKEIIDNNMIDLLSLMDHTPGQGQFLDLEKYFQKAEEQNEGSRKKLSRKVKERQALRKTIKDEQIQELTDYCITHQIPLASHDDDSITKIDKMRALGILISEFPISMEVLEYAYDYGMNTVIGSPNIILGYSHSGNLSAREAIANESVTIICSDYLPHSLLHSLFYLDYYNILSLEQAIPLATINPAKAVNLDSTIGSIEEGKRADLLLVEKGPSFPRVLRTYIDGIEIYKTL